MECFHKEKKKALFPEWEEGFLSVTSESLKSIFDKKETSTIKSFLVSQN
jgi:hypothetical protein